MEKKPLRLDKIFRCLEGRFHKLASPFCWFLLPRAAKKVIFVLLISLKSNPFSFLCTPNSAHSFYKLKARRDKIAPFQPTHPLFFFYKGYRRFVRRRSTLYWALGEAI
jgi:hypothetical protein